ncbi:MAG: hypothetical protein R3B47_21190 [Bacteroidia bacterium]
MTNIKPITVKVITGLLVFKLIVIFLTIAFFYFTKDIDPNSRSALAGIRDGIIELNDLDKTNFGYALGRLIGKQVIPFLLMILALVFVHERRFWPILIVLFLNLLIEASQGIPLLTIIMIILLWTRSAKSYLHHPRKGVG